MNYMRVIQGHVDKPQVDLPHYDPKKPKSCKPNSILMSCKLPDGSYGLTMIPLSVYLKLQKILEEDIQQNHPIGDGTEFETRRG